MDLAWVEVVDLEAAEAVAPFREEKMKKAMNKYDEQSVVENRVVVALGGNALGCNDEEQVQKVREIAPVLVNLMHQEQEMVLVHGNGPQVGIIQKAFMLAHAENHELPDVNLFDACAMSQGHLGFYLQQGIMNELFRQNNPKRIATIITEVEVDAKDPGFTHPEKPIGLFFDKKQVEQQKREHPDWTFMEDSGRGFRRCVASPNPKHIIEIDSIRQLLNKKYVVIACGGGGIPVVKTSDGMYEGALAIIDKDLVSALLAERIHAKHLVILTAVDYVAINFGTPEQINLHDLSVADAEKYLTEDQFGEGSMKPKVQAAVNFVKGHSERVAIIGSLINAKKVLEGTSGTRIHS